MRNSVSNKRWRKGCEDPRLSPGLHTFMPIYAHGNTHTCAYTLMQRKIKQEVGRGEKWVVEASWAES